MASGWPTPGDGRGRRSLTSGRALAMRRAGRWRQGEGGGPGVNPIEKGKIITETDLLHCIETVDKRREAGRPAKELASSEANSPAGKSAVETARIVCTSRAKVERARRVLSDPKEKEAVLAGPGAS